MEPASVRTIVASFATAAGSVFVVSMLWSVSKAFLRHIKWVELSIRVFGRPLP